MFEILSLIAGAAARLVPSLVDLFKRHQDNRHELALLDRQLELGRQQAEQKRAEIEVASNAATDQAWAAALLEAQKATAPTTGNALIDGANALMRPVITFWWAIVLYTAAKVVLVYDAVGRGVAGADLAATMLTDFDRAVVGSVIGFWFTDRALRKLKA